jgi:hypothetical protein
LPGPLIAISGDRIANFHLKSVIYKTCNSKSLCIPPVRIAMPNLSLPQHADRPTGICRTDSIAICQLCDVRDGVAKQEQKSGI